MCFLNKSFALLYSFIAILINFMVNETSGPYSLGWKMVSKSK